MKKPNLFNNEDYNIFIERINKLTADTKPKWGTMNAAQMLAHCAEIQEVCNGKELKKTPFIVKLFKGFIRKMVLNDKPYKQSEQTHPQYVTASTEQDFEQAKSRFIASLDAMRAHRGDGHHSLFGKMNEEERSWGMYKHHTHHFEQFGI